jgi:hypothetical protein
MRFLHTRNVLTGMEISHWSTYVSNSPGAGVSRTRVQVAGFARNRRVFGSYVSQT